MWICELASRRSLYRKHIQTVAEDIPFRAALYAERVAYVDALYKFRGLPFIIIIIILALSYLASLNFAKKNYRILLLWQK